MDGHYVPLRAGAPAVDYGDEALGLYEPLDAKKRRVGVSIACNACRRKKIRCGGQKPACFHCADQNVTCTYRNSAEPSAESKKTTVAIIAMLNSFSPGDAIKVLSSLKSEPNASVILSTLRNKAVSSDNANANTTEDAADSTASRFEFETQNPAAYPAAASYHNAQSYLALTPVSENHDDEPVTQPEQAARFSPAQTDDNLFGCPPDSESDTDMTMSEYCDSRLEKLDIGRWTRTSIDSSTAAKCISLYLETDHPLLGHFDPNLFVSHLVSESSSRADREGEGGNVSDYCSRLLVNALLYWACQMYGYIKPGTENLAEEFCAEAESLWAAERLSRRDSLTAVAAAQFLCLGYLGQGKNHAILTYVSEASEMGTRLGLFGVKAVDGDEDGPVDASQMDNMPEASDAYQRARTFAAWGVFNWLTLMSLFYRQPGLFCPKYPPRLAVPEFRLRDRPPNTPQSPSPSFMGITFPYVCRFWCIVHEVSVLYQSDGTKPWGSMSNLIFAEYKFRELLAWSHSLPQQLKQGREHLHHVQILHLWFHAMIIDIFRPLTQEAEKETHLRTFTGKPASARDVSAASVAQLKYLITDFRLHYKSSNYSILWQTALIYVVNAILNNHPDPNWYEDLLICIYAYQNLGRTWRVAAFISKALLSMALRKSELSSRAALHILRDLERGGMKALTGEMRATFMADLSTALAHPEIASIEYLAREFENNVWMKDYTTVFDDELQK